MTVNRKLSGPARNKEREINWSGQETKVTAIKYTETNLIMIFRNDLESQRIRDWLQYLMT